MNLLFWRKKKVNQVLQKAQDNKAQITAVAASAAATLYQLYQKRKTSAS